jgi:hypothetical protein
VLKYAKRVTEENVEEVLEHVVAEVRGSAPGLFMLAVRYMITAYGPPRWGWSRVESAMRRSLSEKERKMLSRAARELLDEGRREGEARGQAKALTQVLERRFRVLPARVRRRIAGAGPGELETWLNRAVEAATLDAVFSQSAKH